MWILWTVSRSGLTAQIGRVGLRFGGHLELSQMNRVMFCDGYWSSWLHHKDYYCCCDDYFIITDNYYYEGWLSYQWTVISLQHTLLGEFGFWDRTVGDIRPVVAVMWTGCVMTVACCLSVAAVHFELCLVSLHVFEYPLSHSVCSFVELWIHDHFADLYAPTTVWSWNRFCHHCPKLGTVCVRSVCRDYVPLNNAVNVGYRMS